MARAKACAMSLFRRTLTEICRLSFGDVPDMSIAIPALRPASSRGLRPLLTALCFGAAVAAFSAPASARGPDGIADVAEKVIDSVVNISTTSTVEAKNSDKGEGGGRGAMPQLPPGSPFEEFFDDFFKNR